MRSFHLQAISRRLPLVALCWSMLTLALGCGDVAAFDPSADFVRADLVAEQDGVSPGGVVWLGVRLRHAAHWHTYWTVPGDAGLATRLQWSLDPGYRAGAIEWPVPERLRVGDLANYGYQGEVLLPVSVQAPASARIGATARMAVRADWLVCNDICIPGGADLSLLLPVRAATQLRPTPEADVFAATRRRVPTPATLQNARASVDGSRVRLEFLGPKAGVHTLEFFPLEAGRIVAAADQALSVQGQGVRLELQAQAPMAPDFSALRGVLVADGGPGADEHGWAAKIDIALSRSPASPAPGAGKAPVSIGDVASAPLAAAAERGDVPARTAAVPGTGLLAPVAPAASGFSLALALVGAFVGGIILNLMPCVFPVLSLKLIGLVQHRGETHARLRAHGAAFAVGVVLSFLALAGLLIALRAAGSQIGWGFQLQLPLFIAALIGLFFLIGLNLLGAFEFTFGAGLANSRAGQALPDHGLHGSFATGILAAAVASPCTAPFMGAALGYAVTQSAPVALAVFAMLGTGMAAPYLLLTLFPSWLQRLPRPGAWMERLKQLMAFPMFLTCVWLFWVLGQQRDMDAVAWVLVALVGLGLFAWATGLAQRGAPAWRWLAGAAALLAVLTVVPLARSGTRDSAAPLASAADTEWSNWSQDVQRAALAQGTPVFVDFTAAWCITCQANKRLVLHDDRVADAFRQHGVVLMRADWTRRDEGIARELARFARSGVPLYVLYDRRGIAHLLPEILSTKVVLDELATI
ncbi:putative ThiO:disulfide interchange protein [Burkholderiales bacterium]|nr:putative ThiO:disulfide interchange protein [Burkholderiales bacterium]